MDPYRVLGLEHDESNPRTIKRAYNNLLRKHRPERDPVGFREIRDAYEALMSPIWKKKDLAGFLPRNDKKQNRAADLLLADKIVTKPEGNQNKKTGISFLQPINRKRPVPRTPAPKPVDRKRPVVPRTPTPKPVDRKRPVVPRTPNPKPLNRKQPVVPCPLSPSQKSEQQLFYEMEKYDDLALRMVERWWKEENFLQMERFARHWIERVDTCTASFAMEITKKLAHYLALVVPDIAQQLLNKVFAANIDDVEKIKINTIEYHLWLVEKLPDWPLPIRFYLARVIITGKWSMQDPLLSATISYLHDLSPSFPLLEYMQNKFPLIVTRMPIKRVKNRHPVQIKHKEISSPKNKRLHRLLAIMFTLWIIAHIAGVDMDSSGAKKHITPPQMPITTVNKVIVKPTKIAVKDSVWITPRQKQKSMQEFPKNVKNMQNTLQEWDKDMKKITNSGIWKSAKNK